MAKPLTRYEARHVLDALDRLHEGDATGYRWSLWVGLGDGWTPFHERLVRERAVAREGAGLSLTDRGDRIRAKLRFLTENNGALTGSGVPLPTDDAAVA